MVDYPKCDAENVTFGNEKGNDNVIECNAYNQGDKEYITCPTDWMSFHENIQPQILDKLCEYNSSGQKMTDFI